MNSDTAEDPDSVPFVVCRDCGDAVPFETARQYTAATSDADTAEETTVSLVCPTCENDTFDRREGPFETVREWTYRGRTLRIDRHYMGHYCAYVEFDDSDRKRGYYVENESLHGPTLSDPYTPPRGLTWTTTTETGTAFDSARDVCVDEEGDPWGYVGRLSYRRYVDSDGAETRPARIWTPDRVHEVLLALATKLPSRDSVEDADG